MSKGKKRNIHEKIREDYELVEQRIVLKRAELQRLKELYAMQADDVFESKQQLTKMIEALKIQNNQVSSDSQNYVDICTQLALKEAECAYSLDIEKEYDFKSTQESKVEEVNDLRDILNNSLDIFKSRKQNFLSVREEFGELNLRTQKECDDTLAFCEEIKTELVVDVKQSLNIAKYSNEKSQDSKNHYKHLNNTISMVAERILISRDELKGFFKNQIQKMQRELRIIEEADKLRKKRENDVSGAIESSAIEKKSMESFLKKNNLLLLTDDGEENEKTAKNNATEDGKHGGGVYVSGKDSCSTSSKQPKPPAGSQSSNALGNSNLSNIGRTARARRIVRYGQAETVNLENVAQDFVLSCETQGKIQKLIAQKQYLQTQVLHNASLLMLCQRDVQANNHKLDSSILSKDVDLWQSKRDPISGDVVIKKMSSLVSPHNVRKDQAEHVFSSSYVLHGDAAEGTYEEYGEGEDEETGEEGGGQWSKAYRDTEKTINASQNHEKVDSLLTSELESSSVISPKKKGKMKKTFISLGEKLECGIDTMLSGYNFVETGMQYAHSLCSESLSYESKIKEHTERLDNILLSKCIASYSRNRFGHRVDVVGNINLEDSTSVIGEPSSILFNSISDKGGARSIHTGPQANEDGMREEEENEDEDTFDDDRSFAPHKPASHGSPIAVSFAAASGNTVSKTARSKQHGKTLVSIKSSSSNAIGMQEHAVREITLQKHRDMEREKILSSKTEKSEIGIREWTEKQHFKQLYLDILQSELGAEKDIPLELALAKLSSLAVTNIQDLDFFDRVDEQDNVPATPTPQKKSGGIVATTATQTHRQVLIEGLSAL